MALSRSELISLVVLASVLAGLVASRSRCVAVFSLVFLLQFNYLLRQCGLLVASTLRVCRLFCNLSAPEFLRSFVHCSTLQ